MKNSLKLITLASLVLLGSCNAKTPSTSSSASNTPATSETTKSDSSSEKKSEDVSSATTDDKSSEEKKSEKDSSEDQKPDDSSSSVTPVVVVSTSVTITNGATAEVNEGATLQLNATVLPKNTTDKTITWTSSDNNVGTVDDNGLFTAKEVASDSVVTIKAKNGTCEASIAITVKNVLKAATYTFTGDHQTATLTSEEKKAYLEGDSISFKVVTESGYDIDSVKIGDTTLTATSYGNYTATLAGGENTITVATKAVDMKGYAFTKSANPHYANFTADDAVTVYANDWLGNLLVKEQSDEIKATDSYTVSAHIQTESEAPVNYNQLAVGVVAYYQDENNFLIAYTQWVDFDKEGWCREFNLTGLINGNDVGWNDMWLEGAQIKPQDGYDFTVRREKSAFTITLKCGDAEYKKSTSIGALGESKTTHLGIFNQDKKPVTYTNIAYAPYEAPATFEITSGNSTVSEAADGTITYNTTSANWKSGFAVKNYKSIEGKTKYTMSAHLQTSGTSPFTSEAYWGFVPYYKDANNFLMVYMDYAFDKLESRALHIIGQLNGSAINPEWGNEQDMSQTPIYPQNGFDFKVIRDGAKFTVKVTQGSTSVDWEYTRDGFDGTLTGTKVGLWGHGSIGTITATNFTVTVD